MNENKIFLILHFIGLIVLFTFPQANFAVKKDTAASRDKWGEIVRRKTEKRLSENIPWDQPVILLKILYLDSAIFLAVFGGPLFSTFINKVRR